MAAASSTETPIPRSFVPMCSSTTSGRWRASAARVTGINSAVVNPDHPSCAPAGLRCDPTYCNCTPAFAIMAASGAR